MSQLQGMHHHALSGEADANPSENIPPSAFFAGTAEGGSISNPHHRQTLPFGQPFVGFPGSGSPAIRQSMRAGVGTSISVAVDNGAGRGRPGGS